MTEFLKKHFNISMFVFLLAGGLLCYAPEINGEFIFDDPKYVEFNKSLESFDTFKNDSRKVNQRPLYWFSFFVEKRLWGNNPAGYKITNLMFHILASFVFFFFLNALLKRRVDIKDDEDAFSDPGYHKMFSIFGSVLFLLSPLAIEGVSYISGRNNGIGGFFFILGGYTFLEFIRNTGFKRKIFFIVLTLLSFLGSFLFKEIYIVFPVFCMLVYFYAAGITRKIIVYVSAFALVFLLLVSFLTYSSNIQPFPRIKQVVETNVKQFNQEALATNMYAIGYSLRLAVFPNSLNIDHDLPVIKSLSDFRVLAVAFLLIILVPVLWFFRKQLPLSLLAYLSYILLLLPTNSFILRQGYWHIDPLSERHLYAPAFFFTITLMEVIWLLCSRDIRKFRVVLIIVAVVFGVRTFDRNMDFRSNLTLWKASVKYSPDRARPNFNYANALKDAGRYSEALKYAEKAMKLSPKENTLGLTVKLYEQRGESKRAEDLLLSALEKPELQKAGVYHQAGEMFLKKKDYEKALEFFRLSLKKKWKFILPRLSMVYILLDQGKVKMGEKNINILNKILEENRGRYYMGVLFDNTVEARIVFSESLLRFAQKDDTSGIELSEKAIALQPLFTEPYLKLGEYYYVKQQDRKAWDYFYRASKTAEYEKYRDQIKPIIEELQKSLAAEKQ